MTTHSNPSVEFTALSHYSKLQRIYKQNSLWAYRYRHAGHRICETCEIAGHHDVRADVHLDNRFDENLCYGSILRLAGTECEREYVRRAIHTPIQTKLSISKPKAI